MFESFWKFINYWYFRYLLVTELYMVEKWERVMIHIVFVIIFSIMSVFNNVVIVGLISKFTSHDGIMDDVIMHSSKTLTSNQNLEL